MTAKAKVATLDDLRDYAQAFAGWFRDFDRELLASPLSAKERAMIDAYLDEVADTTEQIADIIDRAQSWEPEQ